MAQKMTPRESRKKLWAKRLRAGLCQVCGKTKHLSGVKYCTACKKQSLLDSKNRAKKYPDRNRLYKKRIRKAVIDKYGGRCECCNELNLLFLTIDHINNDGTAERRSRSRNGNVESS